ATENPAVDAKLRQIVGDYSGWHWLNHDPERGMNPQTIDRLGEITAPTLVVLGERDLPDFHHVARILIEKVPGARQVTLAGAGHLANMEAPREFNAMVLEFLAKV